MILHVKLIIFEAILMPIHIPGTRFFHVFSWPEKKHAFLQKKSWPKSPFIFFEAEMSRTIFKSKKNEKKSAKNAFPVYEWASKSLQKLYILHAKSWLCCYVKITIFNLSQYTDGAKRVTKNHSFWTSKLIFFDSKSSFLSFPVYRWSKKCCKIHQNCSFWVSGCGFSR